MFELIFLGTSASTPSVERGLSAHLIRYRQYRFLLDCGEGTQRQILRSGLGFKKLDTVLLTHGHLDHILGLGGLASTLSRWEALDKLDIYGSRTTLERVHQLVFGVALRGDHAPVSVNLRPVTAGQTIAEDNLFRLSAFEVSHRGPGCLGYLFEEKTRRPFLIDKAKALGIPVGPERTQLVAGQAVTLADGRVVTPDEVLGEPLRGTKYVHIGDVGEVEMLRDICHAADALVIEATYTSAEAELAAQYGHLTAAQAAHFAREVEVKTLILTHISRRHQGWAITQEARAIFPDTYVARDFDHFKISFKGVVRLPREKE